MPQQSHIFEVEMPDKSILEIEAPETTPIELIKQRAAQHWNQSRPEMQAQRQQMSAAEFEHNLPPQTIGSAAREGALAIPGAEALGSFIQHPAETLKSAPNALASVAGMLISPFGQLNLIKGAAQGLIEGPQEMRVGLRESNPEAFTRGLVRTASITAPALRTAGELAASGLSARAATKGTRAAMDRSFAPPQIINEIEQKLGPSGTHSQMLTKDIAPELVKDTELRVAKAGKDFDTKLTEKFDAAGKRVQQFEDKISDKAPVPTSPILSRFDQLIAQYQRMGATDALAALRSQKQAFIRSQPMEGLKMDLQGLTEKMVPAQKMTWGQFIQEKRRLGNDLRKGGVWKRIADETATEKDYALNQAYGQLMESAKEVPGGNLLAKANREFKVYMDAMNAAGMDPDSGVRIRQIGKGPLGDIARTGVQPPTRLRRMAKVAVKAAVPAVTAGGLGYAALHEFSDR